MLGNCLVLYAAIDRITGQTSAVRQIIIGVETGAEPKGSFRIVRDQELLGKLNSIASPFSLERLKPEGELSGVEQLIESASAFLEARLPEMQLPFAIPSIQLLGFIGTSGMPSSTVTKQTPHAVALDATKS